MRIVCLDLEGVLIPEVWLGLADRTGIADLRLTTRDIKDYDELMQHRLSVLSREGLGMPDIQAVIAGMDPLPGARTFLDGLRLDYQVAIISDTFYEFAHPLMIKLGQPFLLCHKLSVNADGGIEDYHLRQPDPKRCSVRAFHDLHYEVIAAGDSYNDVNMLEEADRGIFFCAPDNVLDDFPQYPLTKNYSELRLAINQAADDLASNS